MIFFHSYDSRVKIIYRHVKKTGLPLPKTNMAMEHPPFEDVFPFENGDFPMSC